MFIGGALPHTPQVGLRAHTRLHLLRAWHHYGVRFLKAHCKLLRYFAYLPHKITA